MSILEYLILYDEFLLQSPCFSEVNFLHIGIYNLDLLEVAKKCNALRDLVSFAQFKKREKDLWRSDAFSKNTHRFNVVHTKIPFVSVISKILCHLQQSIRNYLNKEDKGRVTDLRHALLLFFS